MPFWNLIAVPIVCVTLFQGHHFDSNSLKVERKLDDPRRAVPAQSVVHRHKGGSRAIPRVRASLRRGATRQVGAAGSRSVSD